MGDKKRKLAEDTPVDEVAPEGKKMKKEKKDKKEKKEKKEKRKAEKEVEATVPELSAEEKREEKEEAKKTYLDSKEQLKEKRERKKAEKKEKREQKEKRSADKADLDDEARAVKKAAKRAKHDKKKVAKAAEEEAAPQEQSATNGDENGAGAEAGASNETAEAGNNEVPQKNARFICFVGNLPYSANLESLTKHFEKNPPAKIRVATKKEAPTKCRGFAFIEFDNYDRMKTCLKLYHHSMFDDGKYPPRRMNVELTAGGGGANSEHRKAKIQAKNEKLNEERQRNAKEIKKDKKKHDKTKPARFGTAASGANAVAVDGAGDDDRFAGMHPSRRGRI